MPAISTHFLPLALSLGDLHTVGSKSVLERRVNSNSSDRCHWQEHIYRGFSGVQSYCVCFFILFQPSSDCRPEYIFSFNCFLRKPRPRMQSHSPKNTQHKAGLPFEPGLSSSKCTWVEGRKEGDAGRGRGPPGPRPPHAYSQPTLASVWDTVIFFSRTMSSIENWTHINVLRISTCLEN